MTDRKPGRGWPWRRDRAQRAALSEEQWRWLREQHPILAGFTHEEDARLRELVGQFLRRKRFEVRGLDGDEAPYRLVVATQACLPILGLDFDWFRGWRTVVLLPREFASQMEETDAGGVVREWEEELAGEAWDEGPIVLSWNDVEESGWGDGCNVVIHEVAHKLDLLDGSMNGRPALHRDMDPELWQRELGQAYEQLCEDERRGRDGAVDFYATESPAEFFAVTSELFFEQPAALHHRFPGVYRQLKAFYLQDPLQRARPASSGR